MNYASGFLKDLKSNSSINQLGTKLKKNISDLKEQGVPTQAPSWLPETASLKEQLVSAASQLQTAVNATDTPLTKTESQQVVSNSRVDTTHRRTISTSHFDSSPTSSSSGSFKINDSVNEPPTVVQDMSMTRKVASRSGSEQRTEAESPQPGSINLRDTPRHRESSVNGAGERRTSSASGRRQQPVPPVQRASVVAESQMQKNLSNEFYQVRMFVVNIVNMVSLQVLRFREYLISRLMMFATLCYDGIYSNMRLFIPKSVFMSNSKF